MRLDACNGSLNDLGDSPGEGCDGPSDFGLRE